MKPAFALRLAATLLAATGPISAATFTVTNTADSGAGSLRQAILDANASFGADDIVFAIPGAGVHTIALASPLPPIAQPVMLDGYSQPGASPNTQPVGQGLNTVLTIEIDGTGAGSSPCLTVNAGNDELFVMAVQGLVINRCAQTAILVGAGGDGASIAGNFIGTDPTGTMRTGGFNSLGIHVNGANIVAVGGSTPFERNLISSFDGAAVLVQNSTGSAVRGNLIGTNAAGDAIIPASPGVANTGVSIASTGLANVGGSSAADGNVIDGFSHGVFLSGNASIVRWNRIGTDATGTIALGNGFGVNMGTGALPLVQENVISGNRTGIFVTTGTGPTIVGNIIGTDATGSIDLGNVEAGIAVFNGSATIGGTGAGEGNTIAFNGTEGAAFSGGILVGTDNPATMRGNRVFANRNIGIDLDGDGVTPNDPFDSDSGSNGLQNFPLISSVVPGASTTHVDGILQSGSSTTYDLDFFSAPVCQARPRGPLQAETFLGTTEVTTDASGFASFDLDLPVVLVAGQRVTATATDPAGNTSELSQGLLLVLDPPSGPSGGGVGSTLTGMAFAAGATVSVGGTPATNVNVMNPETITATMPARPAGSLNTVTVTNPNGTTGALPNGWLADFVDVPGGQLFYDFVVQLVRNGVSGGIGGGLYGVDNSTLRQQMAVFLLKGKHGVCFVPPPCQGVFSDVPCPSAFADWIEALFAAEITGGCGPGLYCPQSPVRRDQMAAFLLKAEHGADFVPPPCTGLFTDVACPSLFADWIEALRNEGITSGCGGTNYCPSNPVTRGQMAVFVTRTFDLP
jgi:IPT/TIG domain/S-layer homology domain